MGKIIRAMDEAGMVRVNFIDSTDIVNRAQKIHMTSPVATAALGRTLSITAIMGSMLKGEADSVTVLIKGDGPLGGIVCVADGKGMVKGYVHQPLVDLPLKPNGKLDVSGAVGKGSLSISKDLGLKEPYLGQVPLVTGEIAEDFTYYFAKSEQTPTAVALGVLVDRDYSVKCAGGLLVQLMPDADDETIGLVERNIKNLSPVTEMMDSGLTSVDIVGKILAGLPFTILDSVEYEYRCDCNLDKIKRALISMGEKELQDIIETEGKAELTCQFCPEVYRLNQEELEELLREAKN